MKIVWGLVCSFVTLFLFGWSLVAIFNFVHEFVGSIQQPSLAASASLDLMPIVLISIFAAIQFFIARAKKIPYRKSVWLPAEIEETDEREKTITQKASRASYVSMYYAVPLAGALITLYPLVMTTMPYFPVLIVMLIPLVQVIVYAITWNRAYYAV
ncbi:hypothetical protein [Geomicrobium sp. JCM 19039]|uniref:hypothetical protein n=1 Tax=Geomicrobium sp. JCM 19039 TaxID=1460636 RepID=UPI00045F2AB3|nr:hypothetical protein [Geomicrobium sp. JCM 19039]GAK13516.1 hypothetical protein JCM19039_3369 [Geomicrobium sp. JCM 19039]